MRAYRSTLLCFAPRYSRGPCWRRQPHQRTSWGHSGGHSGGGGGSFHGHHEGFHHHGFHSFVGGGVFFDPWYPYYFYPYPYDYPYVYSPPVVVEPPPPTAAQEPIQREVVYPTGKYELHGDGINYPWQWAGS